MVGQRAHYEGRSSICTQDARYSRFALFSLADSSIWGIRHGVCVSSFLDFANNIFTFVFELEQFRVSHSCQAYPKWRRENMARVPRTFSLLCIKITGMYTHQLVWAISESCAPLAGGTRSHGCGGLVFSFSTAFVPIHSQFKSSGICQVLFLRHANVCHDGGAVWGRPS